MPFEAGGALADNTILTTVVNYILGDAISLPKSTGSCGWFNI
ncbi:MAG: hypothetical protein ACYDG2_22250 [Ruminiclostridium sp.]